MSGEMVSYKDIEAMAAQVVRSRLFQGITTNEAAITLMLLCQSEGLHPMQALTRYHILNGRPAMKADAMLAEFMRRGGTVKWTEWTNEACEAIFTSSGVPDGVTVRWTMEDAVRAGLMRNPTWKSYPRQMLKARVTSDGVRMADPVVNQGRYTPEEVQDFEPNKIADAEVVGGEPVAAVTGVSTEPAPPTIQSAEGLSTEEYLEQAKAKRAEALERFMPKPDDAPPPTDADAPFEVQLEKAKAEVARKVGRPKSVPEFCFCDSPVMRFEKEEAGKVMVYWECHERNRVRHVMKDNGDSREAIAKACEGHVFKWSGNAPKGD